MMIIHKFFRLLASSYNSQSILRIIRDKLCDFAAFFSLQNVVFRMRVVQRHGIDLKVTVLFVRSPREELDKGHRQENATIAFF